MLNVLSHSCPTRRSSDLIDELEHGLEPHRIIRLLGSLGAKEAPPPLQVFMTTHSPVALLELSGNQLFVVRGAPERHEVRVVGTADGIQSRSEEHTSELQSLMRISYAVFCLKKKKN